MNISSRLLKHFVVFSLIMSSPTLVADPTPSQPIQAQPNVATPTPPPTSSSITTLSSTPTTTSTSTQKPVATNDAAAQSIATMMGPVIEYSLSQMQFKSPSLNPKIATGKIQAKLMTLLKEKFSNEELSQLETIHKNMGGDTLVKQAEVVVQQSQKIFSNDCKMDEVTLTITPTYNELLDKQLVEKGFPSKIRNFFMQRCIQGNNQSSDNNTKADTYVKNSLNNFKKAFTSVVTESQYQASYNFEHSDLGNRYNDVVKESVMSELTELDNQTSGGNVAPSAPPVSSGDTSAIKP